MLQQLAYLHNDENDNQESLKVNRNGTSQSHQNAIKSQSFKTINAQYYWLTY